MHAWSNAPVRTITSLLGVSHGSEGKKKAMSALSVGGRQPAESRRFHSFFPPFSKGGAGGFLRLSTAPARHQSPLAPLYQGGDRSRGPRLGAEPTPNADRAKKIGQTPFILVTSAGHMPRSMAVFEAQGMQPIPAPTEFITHDNIYTTNRHKLRFLK